jgi:hypothetical protein
MRPSILGLWALVAACSSTNPTGNDGGGNDGGGPDGIGFEGSPGAFSCSQGTLYAGDPVYTGDPNLRPTSGTGIKTDPPLVWQTLVIAGTHLYTRQESEVWSVDMSAASPVETKIAGTIPSGSTYDFNAGPCSSANFTQLRGLGAMGDGSIVAADYFANSIVKITNPDNPATCTVSVIVGTQGPLTGLDPSSSSTLPPPGNANGKGAAASFNGPQAFTIDGSGNIFLVDHQVSNNATIVRRIDPGGFASTLATLGTSPGAPMDISNLTNINGTIYAAARDDTNNSYVISIDLQGNITTILGGGSDKFPPVSSGRDPAVAGITNDGKNLILAGDGFVWYLTLTGQLTQLAGTENSIDFFTSGYDPTQPHPAMQLELPIAIGSADENGTGSFNHIVYDKGFLYYRGFANGSSAFIEKIACQ